MKNGDILHNENLTSHEDIISLFGINDLQINCDKFVRVEFTPENESDLSNIKKYVLKVDEKRTPDWFENQREYVTQRLKDFVSKRIITTNQKILTGGLYVIAKNVIIDKVVNAIITDNSGTVTKNSGTVTDNSGTVTDNYGTVTYNSGTVTDNSGTVTKNSGTVTKNYETVTYNYGTVTFNSGTVTNNYGTVTDKK